MMARIRARCGGAAAVASAAILALGSLLLGTEACSVLLRGGLDQCAVDADCPSRGGGAPLDVCRDGICLAGAPVVQPACTSHRACGVDASGERLLCRPSDGTCVKAIAAGCDAILGAEALDADEPIVGALFTSRAPVHEATHRAMVGAATLALGDVAAAGGVRVAGKAHPMALLVCDDGSGHARPRLEEALAHVVDTAGARIVVGGGSAAGALDLAETAAKRNVFVLSSAATIADFQARVGPTVWRASPSDVDQATAIVELAFIQERRFRTAAGSGPKGRMALVVKNDEHGRGLRALIRDRLTINFAPALAPENLAPDCSRLSDALRPCYTEIEYADPAADPAGPATALAALKYYKPGVTIFLGSDEVADVLRESEAVALSLVPPWFIRFYVVAAHARSERLLDTINAFADATLQPTRITGPSPGIPRQSAGYGEYSNPDYATFMTRLALQPASAQIDVGNGIAPTTFDAVHIAAQAAAAGPYPPDAAAMGRAMERLRSEGAEVHASSAGLVTAFEIMGRAEGAVSFHGAMGAYAFAAATRTAPRANDVWCVVRSGASTRYAYASAGIFLEPGGTALRGDLIGQCTFLR